MSASLAFPEEGALRPDAMATKPWSLAEMPSRLTSQTSSLNVDARVRLAALLDRSTGEPACAPMQTIGSGATELAKGMSLGPRLG